MVEPKVSLSLLVPGAGMMSSQECEKNSKDSYNEHKMLITFTKGKDKNQKVVKKPITIKTRKQKLVTQNINICEEAYNYMLDTPTHPKLSKYAGKDKRVWDTMSIDEKLRHHFDLIAYDLNAVSYSYEILGD